MLMGFLQKMSFTQQMILPITVVAFIVLGSVGFVATHDAFTETKNKSLASSLEAAQKSAQQIKSVLDKPFAQIETYGRILETQIQSNMQSRERAHFELREILKNDDSYLAIWSAWEPNAFDGKDAEYANKPNHEQSGRFYPWWIRKGSEITYKTLLNSETPELGDWYFKPMKSGQSMLVEPYSDTIDGKTVIMTSAVYTAHLGNEPKGVVGIDLSLDHVKEFVTNLKPFKESEAYLVTDTNTIVSGPHPEEVMQPFTAHPEVMAAVQAKALKNVEVDGKQYLTVPVPIYNLDQEWMLILETPERTLLASAYAVLWRQVISLTIGQILLMGTVFFVARRSSKKIEDISQNIQGSSTHVTGAIAQLNIMGTELAAVSAKAASAVDETATSLEEITSMVSLNTKNAKEAAMMSSKSAQFANEGEKEIVNLIKSMHAIETSSQKIEEIITIIDDIAFQTNLLALNASVEAARAGDHGKGFAVVADAVRALAQKSAFAAKDIGSLILTSVEQIKKGTHQAQESGHVLEKISDSVRKISQLNQEIASASEEQALGISQITSAINELDNLIQKNTQQAEQIANTAEDIKGQSQVLASTVVSLQGVTIEAA